MSYTDVLNSSSGKNLKETKNIIKSQDNTTTINLSVEESGSLVLLRNCGGAKLINLPPASSNTGVYYDFYLQETLSAHTTTIQSKDGTDYFLGNISDAEVDAQSAVAFNGSSHDQFVVAASADAGTFECRFVCDGDNWLVVNGTSYDISDISAGTSSSNTRTV